MNIGMIWFVPRASIQSNSIGDEAREVLDENRACSFPTQFLLDAVIVKATVSVGGPVLHASHTESFVFAKDSTGAWKYTEKFDELFARNHL